MKPNPENFSLGLAETIPHPEKAETDFSVTGLILVRTSTMAYSICTRSLLLYFMLSVFGNFVDSHSPFWVMGQGALDHRTRDPFSPLLWNAIS